MAAFPYINSAASNVMLNTSLGNYDTTYYAETKYERQERRHNPKEHKNNRHWGNVNKRQPNWAKR